MPPTKIIYVITGPTASGKTAAAIALAQQLGTDIVSADSRQCYREMTIGTAKPTPDELSAVKHYFVDEYSVSEELSAANYEQIALAHLDTIFATHDSAVVCGGTGLYIKALCEGLDEMPAPLPEIVLQTEIDYETNGIAWLQQAVATEDPEFYKAGEIHNPARMLRALAFVRSTHRSIIHYRTQTRKVRPFEVVKIGLELPRPVLYTRINNRVDAMIAEGLVEEVTELLPYCKLKNLQTVGYTEIFDYLDGTYSLPEAIEKVKQHTRNYAKRQMTWFKKDPEITWYDATLPNLAQLLLANKGV